MIHDHRVGYTDTHTKFYCLCILIGVSCLAFTPSHVWKTAQSVIKTNRQLICCIREAKFRSIATPCSELTPLLLNELNEPLSLAQTFLMQDERVYIQSDLLPQ